MGLPEAVRLEAVGRGIVIELAAASPVSARYLKHVTVSAGTDTVT